MPQKIFDDKIGQLTHSAGNITMAASMSSPAFLTIGGQQYKVTSNLVAPLPTLEAAARYQVFAVQSGGVVSLVISQNENSVGPAGYASWKLVGSLMADDFAQFGSFLNIKGVPSSDWMDWDLRLYREDTGVESGSLATAGTTLTRVYKFQRLGNLMRVDARYQHATGTGMVNPAHNVSVVFRIPGSNLLTADARVGYGTTLVAQGVMTCNNASPGAWTGNATLLSPIFLWATSISFTDVTSAAALNVNLIGSTGTNPNFLPASNAALFRFGYKHEFTISQWSNTPIEEL